LPHLRREFRKRFRPFGGWRDADDEDRTLFHELPRRLPHQQLLFAEQAVDVQEIHAPERCHDDHSSEARASARLRLRRADRGRQINRLRT
jgi:hypothetical protein